MTNDEFHQLKNKLKLSVTPERDLAVTDLVEHFGTGFEITATQLRDWLRLSTPTIHRAFWHSGLAKPGRKWRISEETAQPLLDALLGKEGHAA